MNLLFVDVSGEEEQTYVNWMWLYQGHPKRCECGHWFKLVEKAPI
jgi:cytochrome c oxidase subunit 5b